MFIIFSLLYLKKKKNEEKRGTKTKPPTTKNIPYRKLTRNVYKSKVHIITKTNNNKKTDNNKISQKSMKIKLSIKFFILRLRADKILVEIEQQIKGGGRELLKN